MALARRRRGRHRAKTFTDRFPFIGPSIWILSVQYFIAQVIVAWVWMPPYSVSRNTISDLGNTICGPYGGSYVCSPRHDLMNASFIALGAVMAAGSWLIYQEFNGRGDRERLGALAGFAALAVGGLGAFFVGKYPENVNHTMHIVGAGLAIGVGNLGVLVLGLTLGVPNRMRVSMIVLSAVSLAALGLFATRTYLGLGPGGMERIAAYPETLWLIGFGIYISRNHFLKRSSSAPANCECLAHHAAVVQREDGP
jgi:hypothetical membrane protein